MYDVLHNMYSWCIDERERMREPTLLLPPPVCVFVFFILLLKFVPISGYILDVSAIERPQTTTKKNWNPAWLLVAMDRMVSVRGGKKKSAVNTPTAKNNRRTVSG